MTVLRWIFISLAVLSLGGSFLGEFMANVALDSGEEKDYAKNQAQAEVAALAGVAWGALAIAMVIGEGVSGRRYQVQIPRQQQAQYGAGPYPHPPQPGMTPYHQQ